MGGSITWEECHTLLYFFIDHTKEISDAFISKHLCPVSESGIDISLIYTDLAATLSRSDVVYVVSTSLPRRVGRPNQAVFEALQTLASIFSKSGSDIITCQ